MEILPSGAVVLNNAERLLLRYGLAIIKASLEGGDELLPNRSDLDQPNEMGFSPSDAIQALLIRANNPIRNDAGLELVGVEITFAKLAALAVMAIEGPGSVNDSLAFEIAGAATALHTKLAELTE